MWVWNFCVSTFKHDRPCSKNEILENLGKYSNSTLQSVSFKKTSNKYFFTYATFLTIFNTYAVFNPRFIYERSRTTVIIYEVIQHVLNKGLNKTATKIVFGKYLVGSTSKSKILQSDSHQTQRVWILSLYFDPIWRQESSMVRDFKIFASPQIVWFELTNFWSLDPY